MRTFTAFPKIVLFSILFFFTLTIQAQKVSFQANNDTIDVYPFVPQVFNILANDSIPPGDTIFRIIGGGSQHVSCQIDSNTTFTFKVGFWGFGNTDSSTYTILMKSGISTKGKIIFHIHDHSFAYLDINNVSARFSASGNHFFSDNAEFEVPKGSGKTSIFSSAFWIGGKDIQGNLHFAGERYRQGPTSGPANTKPDFYAGPVMDSAFYSIYQDTVWNYIWNLRKTEIDYHRTHYWQTGYQPIHDILTWPGNGNTLLGQAARLAPFADRNGDGIYDPFDGDYPEIRGDQALFFIFNDDRGGHLESWGEKLRVEIHGMAYAFDLPGDSALKNTVFLYYKIYNRSENAYDSTYLGVFTDIDLGYPMDDYIGCDVERNMYFGYNGLPVDGTGQSNAYGENPPSQGVTIIAGPYVDEDGLDNPRFDMTGNQLCDYSVNGVNFGDSIVDNERYGMSGFVYFNNATAGVPSYMTDPNLAWQYYSFLQGIWKDSSRMIYGGNGHISSGGYGPACNFMFPGESDTLNWGVGCNPPNGAINWTEETAANAPMDRRGLGSSGPFTFKPGDVQELDIAFNWARDYGSKTPLSSLEKLRTMVDVVTTSFVSNQLPNGQPFYGINEQVYDTPLQIKVFPNPAQDLIHIGFKSGYTTGEAIITLIDLNGKPMVRVCTNTKSKMSYLNLSGIPEGFYILQVRTTEGIVTSKVIILR